MRIPPIRRQTGILALAIAGSLCACGGGAGDSAASRINGSIHVSATAPAGSIATINGSIETDDGAVLAAARTVNGGITLGRNARAESLTTVNGPVRLAAGARVSGAVTVVKGRITLAAGAVVSGPVTNVSGAIELDSAEVSGRITTVDGDITVLGHSHVGGGLEVDRPNGWFFHVSDAIPRIVIGPGAVVDGPLRFLHKVALFVSTQARIGPVSGATPVPFTGEAPPAG
ncbi:MAG: hypothetical protein KGL34_04035 [Gammaproteobacteria bacterium]|nr:hypothetical protein [Gammaproteobacteria bacterium]